METKLLEKENEYRKENEKVELQSKKLLERVNDVMKIQENLIKDTIKTKTELAKARKENFPLPQPVNNKTLKKNNRLGILAKDIEECLNIPATVDDMGPEAAKHFYKAKVKTVVVEKEIMRCEMKICNEELKKLQKENQQLSEEKEKWFTSFNSSKVNLGKLEAQIVALNLKIQNKECQNAALKKEVERLKKELKQNSLNFNSTEVKLNRAYEEIEKTKTALKNAKDEEKEFKENFRKQISELQASVKQIEKHKMELLHVFKKQSQLINNLKKQKVQLETQKVAEFAEAEYLKILEMRLD